MKILLSQDEMFEIKLPEQIGVQEFEAIVTKFNFLLKNFAKFNLSDSSEQIVSSNQDNKSIILTPVIHKQYKKHNSQRWAFLRDNRNVFIEILRTYYLKPIQDFDDLMKKYSLDFQRIDISSVQMRALREYHKVNPKEIGLIKFPNRYEQVDNLKLNENQREEGVKK